MQTRRDALKGIAAATAAAPVLASAQEAKERSDQPGHVHTEPVVQITAPGKPSFFQPMEFETIEAMTERIIPRSETPGAKDVGVTMLIDRALMVRENLGPAYRAGIADLNAMAYQKHQAAFAALKDVQQDQLLVPMSLEPDTPMGRFFQLVKEMTVDAYYKTEQGLKTELGWHGNTFLPEFIGCDHPEHQG